MRPAGRRNRPDERRGLDSAQQNALTAHEHPASQVTSGTFDDARIAESNVTQHQAAIDHDALANYAAGQHRTINDAGSGTTDLWSADKIGTDLAAKANTSHTHAASDVTSGTFADARVSESSVTQHEGAIDHNALAGFLAAEHWAGNDAGTGAAEVWSASKLQEALEIREGQWRTGASGATLTTTPTSPVLAVAMRNTDATNHYTLTLGTSTQATVKIADEYRIYASLCCTIQASGEHTIYIRIVINGSPVVGTIKGQPYNATGSGSQVTVETECTRQLAANDVVEAQVYCSSGASVDIADTADGIPGGYYLGISRKVGVA